MNSIKILVQDNQYIPVNTSLQKPLSAAKALAEGQRIGDFRGNGQ
jgi:hypothetical protein